MIALVLDCVNALVEILRPVRSVRWTERRGSGEERVTASVTGLG